MIYEPISKRLTQYIAVLSTANTEDIALGTVRDLTKILKKIQEVVQNEKMDCWFLRCVLLCFAILKIPVRMAIYRLLLIF